MSIFKVQSPALIFCIFNFAFFMVSCGSVPNLEPAECTEARGVVKEFYSSHFGGEMKFSVDELRRREKFLTPELVKSLPTAPTDNDVFTTNSTDYPKAFRLGKCRVIEPAITNIEILLFWKTDTRSEQRAISVEAVKRDDKWLINKILN